MEEKESKANYLLYLIVLVIILIVATFAITFAYYKVNVSSVTTLVNINSTLECIDLDLSNNGTNISLSHNYPITDKLAETSGSITPVTVTVTNNCSDSKKYTLALSTMASSSATSDYIEDNKIRYKVLKNNSTFKSIAYLNSLSKVSTSNQAYKDLTGDSGELSKKYSNYTVKNIYAIEDTQSIAANASNTYQIYLWVDYYEGDSQMYTSSTAIHDESYDGTTEGKKFAAAISLSLNP